MDEPVSDIVSPDLDEPTLRARYGKDANEIIAFRRFLSLHRDGDGKTICPPHFYKYAMGEMSGADLIAEDDRLGQPRPTEAATDANG